MFERYLARFEAYLLAEKRVAYNTFLAYKGDLQQFFSTITTHNCSDITALTPELLQKFLAQIMKNGVSARSRARKIAALRLFFRYCHDHHPEVPFLEQHLITPRFENTLPTYCTAHELEALLKSAKDSLRDKVIIYLLYSSGMRVSELIAVRLSDIRFSEQVIRVKGKGGKTRLIPLPRKVLEIIRLYAQSLPENIIADPPKDYLFPVVQKGIIHHISRQVLWGAVKKIARNAAITKDISPHTLRHTLATQSLQQGWDLKSVQQMLGHEQLATTQMYTHIGKQHLKDIYKKAHPRAKDNKKES